LKYLLSLLILPIHLFAVNGDIRIRAGVFGFADHIARKIYGRTAPDVELQGDILIHCLFNPWINANFVWKEGRSGGLHDKTDLKLGTLSVGSNLVFPCHQSSVQFYLGPGLSTAYLRTRDRTKHLPRKTERWSIGAVGKSGLLIHLGRAVLLDLFFDYYYQPVRTRSSLKEREIDIGGFRTGGGLGWEF